MTGGAGNDTYVVDSTLDKVVETLAGVAGGTDTVESSVTYTLGLNVENLTLTGERPTSTPPATRWPTSSPATTATTSCSAWRATTPGRRRRRRHARWRPGHDAMAGGGNDTYVLDNAGDAITEIPGDGIDTARIA